jgi:serralysin
VVGDFTAGQDKIDLSTLDANTATTANDAFTEIIAATAAFTKAGQLKFANGVLYGNVDADADAEFAIQLTGVTTFSAADLVL